MRCAQAARRCRPAAAARRPLLAGPTWAWFDASTRKRSCTCSNLQAQPPSPRLAVQAQARPMGPAAYGLLLACLGICGLARASNPSQQASKGRARGILCSPCGAPDTASSRERLELRPHRRGGTPQSWQPVTSPPPQPTATATPGAPCTTSLPPCHARVQPLDGTACLMKAEGVYPPWNLPQPPYPPLCQASLAHGRPCISFHRTPTTRKTLCRGPPHPPTSTLSWSAMARTPLAPWCWMGWESWRRLAEAEQFPPCSTGSATARRCQAPLARAAATARQHTATEPQARPSALHWGGGAEGRV